MKTRVTLEEAEAFAKEHLASKKSRLTLRPTGLQKVCPRCGRRGWVFLFSYDGPKNMHAAVIWDGKARGVPGDEADVDQCRADEVFDPEFGCGYDTPKGRR